MSAHRIPAIDLFAVVLVAALLALILATSVQPASKRLAALVSDHIAAHPTCGGLRVNDATGLTCLFYQAASANR